MNKIKLSINNLKTSVYDLNKEASENTKTSYFTSFKKFFVYLEKNNINFNSFEDFLEYLTNNFNELIKDMKIENKNSIEMYLKTIVKYNKLLKNENNTITDLSSKFNKIINANKLIREENFINSKNKDFTIDDIKNHFNNIVKEKKEISIVDKIILSFYINNPPLRSSNFNNLIYRSNLKSEEFDSKYNYYLSFLHIVKISNEKLKVKTTEDFLNIKIDNITIDLFKILIQEFKPINDQILWDFNTNTFTKKVNSLLKKHFEMFDNNISVNTIRHLYASSVNIDKLNLREIKRTANRMNQKHIDQFLLYRQIKNKNDFTLEKINSYIDNILDGNIEEDIDIEEFLNTFKNETDEINEKLENIDLKQHKIKYLL